MPIIINTNVSSLIAQRNLTSNTNELTKSLQRLSSGFRINSAADDSAGLQISETLNGQIRGVSQAINNAQDGSNLLAVAEGSLSVIGDNLQRIRELTVQAANDTNGTDQKNAIKQEIQARLDDITRIANSTKFNGTNLLTSAAGATPVRLQIGQNSSQANDTIDISKGLGSGTTSSLGIGTVDISSNSTARAFLTTIDTALLNVNSKRATIGSLRNRIDSAVSNLSIQRENFTSANSRIRDVDVAQESANLTRNQILQQAAASILSQANQAPNLALSLIRQ